MKKPIALTLLALALFIPLSVAISVQADSKELSKAELPMQIEGSELAALDSALSLKSPPAASFQQAVSNQKDKAAQEAEANRKAGSLKNNANITNTQNPQVGFTKEGKVAIDPIKDTSKTVVVSEENKRVLPLSNPQLTYGSLEPYQGETPSESKSLYKRIKDSIINYFFKPYDPIVVQEAQQRPLLYTNKKGDFNQESTENASYTKELSTKGIFIIKNGNYNNIVEGLGSESQYKSNLGTNIYADLAQNVADALATIDPVNADGSLRHKFNVITLVTKACQALGFYDLEVTVPKQDDKELVVVVKPGKPALITDQSLLVIRGQGTGLSTFRKQEDFFAPPGSVFKAATYEDAKSKLTSTANDYGYFDAKWERSQVLVNPQAQKATWLLDFNTGSRYTIGKLAIEGSQIRPYILFNSLDYKAGDYFSTDEIGKTVSTFQGAPYFDSVFVKTDVDNQSKTVDITYLITPAKANSVDLSLGYDTDEGPRTKINYDRHYIGSRGLSLKTSSYVSRKKQTVDLSLKKALESDPFVKDISGGFSYERLYQKAEDSYSSSLIGRLSYSRLPLDNWQFSTSLYGRLDYWFEFNNKHHSSLIYTDFLISRTSLTTNVQLAYKTSFLLNRLVEKIPDYHYASLKLRHQFPITSKMDVNLGLRLGKIYTKEIFDLPPPLRLYSGGNNSIRGYAYQSISDYNGVYNHGGRAKTEFTVEVLHQIALPELKGVVFVDGGNSTDKVTFKNLHYGAGLGVRYDLPVGYASFDIAYPLVRTFKWSNISLYLGIQTQF